VMPRANTGIAASAMSPSTVVAEISPSVLNTPGMTRLALTPRGASSTRSASKAARRPRLEAA
jgi:hypothetical protein